MAYFCTMLTLHWQYIYAAALYKAFKSKIVWIVVLIFLINVFCHTVWILPIYSKHSQIFINGAIIKSTSMSKKLQACL